MFHKRTMRIMAKCGANVNESEAEPSQANSEIIEPLGTAQAKEQHSQIQESSDQRIILARQEIEDELPQLFNQEIGHSENAQNDLLGVGATKENGILYDVLQENIKIGDFEVDSITSELIPAQPGPSCSVFPTRVLRDRKKGAVLPFSSDSSEDDDDSIKDPFYDPHDDIDDQLVVTTPLHHVHHVVADSEGENDEIIENLNTTTGRAKKGRKRKFIEQNRAQKKENKNSNQSYINYKGVKVNPKGYIDFVCNCPKKCNEKISSERRKQQFDRFWSLQSYNSQTNFIAACVKEFPKKRIYGRDQTKRNFSRKYTLDSVVVCRVTFIRTLSLTTCRIQTALNKFHGRMPLTDQRGKIAGGRNKLPDSSIQKVVDQINRIPRYISHYCRSKTEANFLPPGTTLQKMYEMYCLEENSPVSLASYKRIFYTRFNLKMKAVKKDTCNFCDTLKTQIDNETDLTKKENLKVKQSSHFEIAEDAQRRRRQDFDTAKNNEEYECLTFDMQKTLPLPRIPTSIVFYKRQLWVYNAGIHSGKEDRGYCYVWVEGEAGRGSQEVGSCLLKHIQKYLSPAVKHLSLWSDSCGGQNRNIKMTLYLSYILQNTLNLETITLNFLISGHSFLPNDSDFSDIECKLKTYQRLYTPNDYIEIMKTCRKKKPFIVIKMNSADFFGVSNIEKSIVNRRQTETAEKINWLHIRSIKLEKNQPFIIFFRQHNFSNAYQAVNIKKNNIRRRLAATNDAFASLVPLWPEGKAIAEPKLNNLKEMLHLIPSDALPFYASLRSDSNIVEDVAGFDVAVLDFDVDAE